MVIKYKTIDPKVQCRELVILVNPKSVYFLKYKYNRYLIKSERYKVIIQNVDSRLFAFGSQ